MLSIPSLQMNFVFSHGDMQQFYEQYLGIQKRKEVIALKVKKLAKSNPLELLSDFKFDTNCFDIVEDLTKQGLTISSVSAMSPKTYLVKNT